MESRISGLERLARLASEGRLTEVEYEDLKRELLEQTSHMNSEISVASRPSTGEHDPEIAGVKTETETSSQFKNVSDDTQQRFPAFVPTQDQLALAAPTGSAFKSLSDFLFPVLWVSVAYWALEATLGFGLASPDIWQAFWGAEGLPEWMLTFEDWYPLILLGTGIFFVIWSFQAHSHLHVLEREGIRHRDHETIWWWFVPIANFFMPYKVINETARGTAAPLDDANWGSRPFPRIVLWWTWAFAGGLVAILISRNAINSATYLDDISGMAFIYGLGSLSLAAAALICPIMVRQITAGQSVLMRRLLERNRQQYEPPS
jgi:hypothetical protein